VSVGSTSTVRPPRLPTTITWVCLRIVSAESLARARNRSVPLTDLDEDLTQVTRRDVRGDPPQLPDDVERHVIASDPCLQRRPRLILVRIVRI
jgi:hypothetical protein